MYYVDLGRYIDHYSTLKKAWDDLKAYLAQRCPRMIESLKGTILVPVTSIFFTHLLKAGLRWSRAPRLHIVVGPQEYKFHVTAITI